ncbi:MAG: NAD(P)-dependent oxidoreductase [candidate division Zixibacteria bacterium]|nr:NAD(P)-dependent oxidoreductase [candidate division Zixibacteria bacterium]
MAPHVLVTGGSGYLGSVLCEHLLDAGYHVTALDNLMFGQTSLLHLCTRKTFEFVLGDVRNESLMGELMRKTDICIPLAAIVGAPSCNRDPILAQSVNYDEATLLGRLKRPDQLVLYPTTNSGYGTRTSDMYCTEDTPLEPISLYERTKVDAERYLMGFPNVIVFRLATLFGVSPRMRLDLLVNHFVYAAFADGYIVIFEKDFKRNFVHVRDVADAMLFAVEHVRQMAGQCYNVGLDSANLSKGELAEKIKEHVPHFFIHFSDIGSDPDKRNYIVSNQRLREAGFEAQRTLDAGIVELLKAYRMMGPGVFRNA